MSNASTFLAIPNKNHTHTWKDIQDVPDASNDVAGVIRVTNDISSISEHHAISAKAFSTFAEYVSEKISEAGTIEGDQTINGSQTVNGNITVNGAVHSKTDYKESISDINWDYSGFYRTNNVQLNGKATPGLVAWVAHSSGKANGGGIGFAYASTKTYRMFFDANGNYGGMVQMFTDDYHPAADKLTTARTIKISGDGTGEVKFDGSANAEIALTVDPTKHSHEVSQITQLETLLSKKLSVDANAVSATKFKTPMTLKLGGEVTGSGNISGDAEVTIQATIDGRIGRSVSVTGALTATGDITAFYSDARLKTVNGKLENALDKVKRISAYYTSPNGLMQEICPEVPVENDLTLLVQEVEAVLPEAITFAQFDRDENGNSVSGQDYKTIKMLKLIPLLIEAVKDLSAEVEQLRR